MSDGTGKLNVTAARACGVPETRLLLKYPARLAINPVVCAIGFEVNRIFSELPIVAVVLGLTEPGDLLPKSFSDLDMHVAGAILLLLTVVIVVMSSVSDLLLAWLDPRIRPEGRAMGFPGQRETPAEWRDRERRERNCAASQGTLIRWRFRRHRAAMIGAAVLLTMAFPGLFADSSRPVGPRNAIATTTTAARCGPSRMARGPNVTRSPCGPWRFPIPTPDAVWRSLCPANRRGSWA